MLQSRNVIELFWVSSGLMVSSEKVLGLKRENILHLPLLSGFVLAYNLNQGLLRICFGWQACMKQ